MLLYSLIYSLLLPIFIIRTIIKDKNSLRQKLGFGYKKHNLPIHIHCVSVGEFNASIPLIDKFLEFNQVVITTTTKTGAKACKNHYKNKVSHYYFPFDLQFFCKRFIKNINPAISIILETEIWPNFIAVNKKHNIKTVLINARLSDKSYNGYKKFQKFTINTLNKLDFITTQDKFSDDNFKKLGVKNSTICGNIKFDIKVKIDSNKLNIINSIINKRAIVVCGSTHKNEEKILVDSYQKNPCNSLLVLIPRHPNRFKEVENLLIKKNVNYIKQSDNSPCSAKTQILLADSMGFVIEYYSRCDAAFIGGSLVATGGHNMLESIALKKLTISGKWTFNFKHLVQNLTKSKSYICIDNSDELFDIIKNIEKDKEFYQETISNSFTFLTSNTGATENIFKKIIKLFN